ncbi:MAG TPA: PHP domain-containing protein [bacterium]
MENHYGHADLHLHTNRSDGYYSPKELIDLIATHGLRAIAIVDHDEISGLHEAIDYGSGIGIEVISGVELSVNYLNYDLHILAYCFDPQNSQLVDHLKMIRIERLKRARKIVEKLNRLGMPIAFDAVLKKSGAGSVGRPHIAGVLLDEGYVYSFQDAFNRYLGDGKPANIDKYRMDIQATVNLVRAAGGICSIAHPGLMLGPEDLLFLIKAGVQGIEVVHPKHNPEQQRNYRTLVQAYGLVETGGSDFHGGKKGDDVLGKYTIPYVAVARMKEAVRFLVNS